MPAGVHVIRVAVLPDQPTSEPHSSLLGHSQLRDHKSRSPRHALKVGPRNRVYVTDPRRWRGQRPRPLSARPRPRTHDAYSALTPDTTRTLRDAHGRIRRKHRQRMCAATGDARALMTQVPGSDVCVCGVCVCVCVCVGGGMFVRVRSCQ